MDGRATDRPMVVHADARPQKQLLPAVGEDGTTYAVPALLAPSSSSSSSSSSVSVGVHSISGGNVEASGSTVEGGDNSLRQLAFDWVSGGLAGCIAKTTTAPVERVKLLIQTQQANQHVLSGQVKPYSGACASLDDEHAVHPHVRCD